MDPAGEVEPEGQLVQLEAPAAEYVLAEQDVHVDAPLALYVPAAHCAHEVIVPPRLMLY